MPRIIQTFRHYWLTIAFIGGFATDIILLNKIDDVVDNAILFFYVLLASISLLVFYGAVAGKFGEKSSLWFRTYTPLAIQYSFGGLLSGMLIFYGRSGDVLASWPFLLVIAGAILGNELIRDRTRRLVFNLAFFFIGFLPYVVLVTSVLSGMMGPLVFVVSGFIALLLMYWFIQILFLIIPRFIAINVKSIILTIGAIYVAFNGLYFSNIIPPIPLSLKELGIYHSVIRFENDSYQLKWQDQPWWRIHQQSDAVFYPSESSSVFCYAQIYAPIRLETTITHLWEYYDESKGEWTKHANLSYPISGGREGGYRGYTMVSNFRPGKWRCLVETERGQILGRRTFTIAPVSETPPESFSTRTQ